MRADLTRRSIVGGTLALPLAALPAPAVASATAVDRGAWDTALAEYRRAEDVELAFSDTWDTATRAVHAEIGPEPELELTCKAGPLSFTRAEIADAAAQYRDDPIMSRMWHIRGQINLHDRWTAYEAARGRARARHDLDALDREAERLSLVAYKAWWRLIETPAPDIAALALKMAMMQEHDSYDCPSAIDAIIADARRLAGEAVA